MRAVVPVLSNFLMSDPFEVLRSRPALQAQVDKHSRRLQRYLQAGGFGIPELTEAVSARGGKLLGAVLRLSLAADKREAAKGLAEKVGKSFKEGRHKDAFQGLTQLRSMARGSKKARAAQVPMVELADGSPARTFQEGRDRWLEYFGNQEVAEVGGMLGVVEHLAAFRRGGAGRGGGCAPEGPGVIPDPG